ncbi:hypothetical protein OQA88_6574 [Cercophora sp. LCS_1]
MPPPGPAPVIQVIQTGRVERTAPKTPQKAKRVSPLTPQSGHRLSKEPRYGWCPKCEFGFKVLGRFHPDGSGPYAGRQRFWCSNRETGCDFWELVKEDPNASKPVTPGKSVPCPQCKKGRLIEKVKNPFDYREKWLECDRKDAEERPCNYRTQPGKSTDSPQNQRPPVPLFETPMRKHTATNKAEPVLMDAQAVVANEQPDITQDIPMEGAKQADNPPRPSAAVEFVQSSRVAEIIDLDAKPEGAKSLKTKTTPSLCSSGSTKSTTTKVTNWLVSEEGGGPTGVPAGLPFDLMNIDSSGCLPVTPSRVFQAAESTNKSVVVVDLTDDSNPYRTPQTGNSKPKPAPEFDDAGITDDDMLGLAAKFDTPVKFETPTKINLTWKGEHADAGDEFGNWDEDFETQVIKLADDVSAASQSPTREPRPPKPTAIRRPVARPQFQQSPAFFRKPLQGPSAQRPATQTTPSRIAKPAAR